MKNINKIQGITMDFTIRKHGERINRGKNVDIEKAIHDIHNTVNKKLGVKNYVSFPLISATIAFHSVAHLYSCMA